MYFFVLLTMKLFENFGKKLMNIFISNEFLLSVGFDMSKELNNVFKIIENWKIVSANIKLIKNMQILLLRNKLLNSKNENFEYLNLACKNNT